jgi:hypothetical protein
MSILKGGDDVWCLGWHGALMGQKEEGKKETFGIEVSLWKGPEQIEKREEDESEKSIVFTLGMICYGIVSEKFPYDSDTLEIALGKKVDGERPDLSDVEKEGCSLCSVMERCWNEDPSERPGLCELKKKIKKEEKKEEKKEKKKKKKKKKGSVGKKEGVEDEKKDENKEKEEVKKNEENGKVPSYAGEADKQVYIYIPY